MAIMSRMNIRYIFQIAGDSFGHFSRFRLILVISDLATQKTLKQDYRTQTFVHQTIKPKFLNDITWWKLYLIKSLSSHRELSGVVPIKEGGRIQLYIFTVQTPSRHFFQLGPSFLKLFSEIRALTCFFPGSFWSSLPPSNYFKIQFL